MHKLKSIKINEMELGVNVGMENLGEKNIVLMMKCISKVRESITKKKINKIGNT